MSLSAGDYVVAIGYVIFLYATGVSAAVLQNHPQYKWVLIATLVFDGALTIAIFVYEIKWWMQRHRAAAHSAPRNDALASSQIRAIAHTGRRTANVLARLCCTNSLCGLRRRARASARAIGAGLNSLSRSASWPSSAAYHRLPRDDGYERHSFLAGLGFTCGPWLWAS